MRHAALIGALCTVCLTACSEETGPNVSGVPDIDIVKVSVSPSLDTMFVADTLRPTDRLQIKASVIGRLGPIPNAAVAWTSSNPEVATVSETGLVTPSGYGTTVITASASLVAKATVVVMPATRTVQVSPVMDTIFVDEPMAAQDSIRLIAKSFDQNGNQVTGVVFSWTSSATTTATVNIAGGVRARSIGLVNITATAGEESGSASVRVASIVKAIQVTSPVTTVLAKDTVQLTATALGYDDKPMAGRTFTWTSSNPAVATVDANGRAIFLRAGSATFTAKSAFTTSAVTVGALERQFQSISSGDDYTCGFTNLGRGYCWGVGDFGLLASGADSSCYDAYDPPLRGATASAHPCTISPKRFAGPAIEFTAIETGVASACGISKDRLIYCWGSDESGQIGNGSKGGGAQATLATVAQERFDSISVGGFHACALSTTRQAYCWGNDQWGQLGDRRRVNSSTPIPVFGGRTYSAIAAGERHTCGISSGQVFCWGSNGSGQLGIGSLDSLFTHDKPEPVSSTQTFVAISAGGDHTCALSASGEAFCWGRDTWRESGGSGSPVLVPTSVGGPAFARISAGRYHTCGMTSAGAASCWGRNDWGQIGNGSFGGPVGISAVSSSVAFRSITPGTFHTCGVGVDGETYCWGSNVFGSLGNELQAAMRETPQKVAAPR
jgi:alpha-tubulin suppressor-like RCC1 family protein